MLDEFGWDPMVDEYLDTFCMLSSLGTIHSITLLGTSEQNCVASRFYTLPAPHQEALVDEAGCELKCLSGAYRSKPVLCAMIKALRPAVRLRLTGPGCRISSSPLGCIAAEGVFA